VLRALVDAKLVTMVAALRSDAFALFQKIGDFTSLLNRGAILNLLPPTMADLEDMVRKPVAACRPPLDFEQDESGRSLADVLVKDAKGGDALPLLQVTLQRLYEAEEKRHDGILRFADYPGLSRAVTATANEAFAGLDGAAKAELPALITALVRDVTRDLQSGAGVPVVVPLDRTGFERDRPSRVALTEAFVSARLMTTEDADGVARIRPVHDALLRTWPEAARLVDENSALIRIRRALEPLVEEWSHASAERKPDFIATSPALIAGAQQLLERFGDDLSAETRQFIADSLAADAQRRDAIRLEQERRVRDAEALAAARRRTVQRTSVALAAALIFACLALWQKATAEKERARAEASLTAATETANTLVSDLAKNLRDRTGMPIDLVRYILNRAQQLQEQLLNTGESAPRLRFSAALALNELVLTLLEQGGSQTGTDVAAALNFANRFQAIMSDLAKIDPGNRDWQYELSLSHNRIGDALAVASRHAESLDHYNTALGIRQRLAEGAAEPRWRDALAASYTKMGDALRALVRREEALEAYDKALRIREGLAAGDPENSQWQQELAVAFERKGLILDASGQFDQALELFTKSLSIWQRLVAKHDNVQWRRNLSISYERIGDILVETDKKEQALLAFKSSFDIRKQLADADPGNLQRQRDLAVMYGRMGDLMLGMQRQEDGIQALRASLAIRERLAAADPGNILWQTDLVIALRKLALAGDDAKARLARALELARRLDADGKLGPEQAGWIEDLEEKLESLEK
jgi:tetratricopeptide (TPR) repeat protein